MQTPCNALSVRHLGRQKLRYNCLSIHKSSACMKHFVLLVQCISLLHTTMHIKAGTKFCKQHNTYSCDVMQMLQGLGSWLL